MSQKRKRLKNPEFLFEGLSTDETPQVTKTKEEIEALIIEVEKAILANENEIRIMTDLVLRVRRGYGEYEQLMEQRERVKGTKKHVKELMNDLMIAQYPNSRTRELTCPDCGEKYMFEMSKLITSQSLEKWRVCRRCGYETPHVEQEIWY